MSKVSPRPWTYLKGIEVFDYEGRIIMMPDTVGNIECDKLYPNNLAHIVKCVNQHDKLKQHKNKLREKVEYLENQLIALWQEHKFMQSGFNYANEELAILGMENKQLKQALEVLIDIVSGNNPKLNLNNYKKLIENMEDEE